MNYLSRRTTLLRRAAGGGIRRPQQPLPPQFLPSISTLPPREYSTAGYGDQSGDPISSNPQDQGPRPRIDTEHPGPEPVSEGHGKSGIKGKPVGDHPMGTAGEGGHAVKRGGDTASESSGKKSSNTKARPGVDDISGVGSRSGGGDSATMSGAKPKISDAKDPGEEEREDVLRHNREMDQRYNHKSGDKDDETVDPKFWSGQGGRDREP